MRLFTLALALILPSTAFAFDTCDTELVDAYTATLDATLATEEQIGLMADRIGEMADRIDDMADKIVVVNDTSQANSLALAQLLTTLDTSSGDAVVVQSDSGSYILYAVPVTDTSTTDSTSLW